LHGGSSVFEFAAPLFFDSIDATKKAEPMQVLPFFPRCPDDKRLCRQRVKFLLISARRISYLFTLPFTLLNPRFAGAAKGGI
jgi:hypothetical protein